MLFKPPLTLSDLQAIQERNRDNADVFTLLWEIKRLRAIVLRADQLQRSIDGLGGGAGMILTALRDELKDEPVVEELRKLME
jgi:hypothetical protein